jgi:hypothetical protein
MALVGAVSLLVSCGPKRPIGQYQELAVSSVKGLGPSSVAVLPFGNRTVEEGLEELVRASFYSHLSVRAYRDLELSEVDRRLGEALGPDPGTWLNAPVKELGRILGCDAVVMGEVTTFSRVYAAIYSQMAVGASISVWDTRSGRKIWQDEHVVRYHEGGIPFSPFSVPLISVRSGLNLRPGVKVRAVDELARHLAMRMPAPKPLPPPWEQGRRVAYELQAGAFLDEKRAHALVGILRLKGYPAFMRSVRDDRGLWHRVILGPYEDPNEALRLKDEVREIAGASPIIREVPARGVPLAGDRG